MGKIRSDPAENLCLDFGCLGKDFFAKVSEFTKMKKHRTKLYGVEISLIITHG